MFSKTIKIFTTGGTIDKVYFDANSEYQVGRPQIERILAEANLNLNYSVESLTRKDSLEISSADRQALVDKVANCQQQHILITHGTDTLVTTAQALMAIKNKTIVLTGAMQPATMLMSDAVFNVGFALAAVQTLAPSIYIAINGNIFHPNQVSKNHQLKRFEVIK